MSGKLSMNDSDPKNDLPHREVIDQLPVSDSWKRVFRLIDKAGGPSFPNLKSLSVEERAIAYRFNFLAFLFGPLYYAFKGMVKKALLFLVLAFAFNVALSLLMEAVGFGEYDRYLVYGIAAVFAVRANIDYYKKMVLGDNGWW